MSNEKELPDEIDKNDNQIPDNIEGYALMVAAYIFILTGVFGFFFGGLGPVNMIGCFTLGAGLLGGEEVKKYLENK